MNECRRFIVHGRVQGVFFRAGTRERARELGLTGWVKNLPDGRVEARAHGPANALDTFHDWLRQGPPAAHVTRVDATPTDDHDTPTDFHIR